MKETINGIVNTDTIVLKNTISLASSLFLSYLVDIITVSAAAGIPDNTTSILFANSSISNTLHINSIVSGIKINLTNVIIYILWFVNIDFTDTVDNIRPPLPLLMVKL